MIFGFQKQKERPLYCENRSFFPLQQFELQLTGELDDAADAAQKAAKFTMDGIAVAIAEHRALRITCRCFIRLGTLMLSSTLMNDAT
jgi:hypothetical protein